MALAVLCLLLNSLFYSHSIWLQFSSCFSSFLHGDNNLLSKSLFLEEMQFLCRLCLRWRHPTAKVISVAEEKEDRSCSGGIFHNFLHCNSWEGWRKRNRGWTLKGNGKESEGEKKMKQNDHDQNRNSERRMQLIRYFWSGSCGCWRDGGGGREKILDIHPDSLTFPRLKIIGALTRFSQQVFWFLVSERKKRTAAVEHPRHHYLSFFFLLLSWLSLFVVLKDTEGFVSSLWLSLAKAIRTKGATCVCVLDIRILSLFFVPSLHGRGELTST